MNANRIVRVENNELHEHCETLAELSKCSYQTAFSEIIERILNGHNLNDDLIITLAVILEHRREMKWK